MESAIPAGHPPHRPIPSLFIGAVLLLHSGSILLLRMFWPELADELHLLMDPPATSLLIIMLGGLYLLACLHHDIRWRHLHQRIMGGAMLIISALLLYHAIVRVPVPEMAPPAANTLAAFLLAGGSALLAPSVRSLSQLAGIFLLILLFATLAILGITLEVLDYQPILETGTASHINLAIGIGLLLFAIGLSYTTWWCHRRKTLDPVGGITLVASSLLIFSALVGAGLIYSVASSYLQMEIRQDLATLINERSARIVTMLHHGQELSQLLIEEAQHSPEGATQHHFTGDYALRVTNSNGSVIAARNGEWFEQKTVAAITNHQMTLWRGDHGHCQLRTSTHTQNSLIETSVPLDLSPILNASLADHDSENLVLCAYMPDGRLHCLSHGQSPKAEAPPLLSAGAGSHFQIGKSTVLYGEDKIQAIMPIPEFNLVAYMVRSNQAIYGPLFHRLYLILPLAVLLLGASVGLIAWRIHPLAKQLHRSEQRYRTLVDGAADAILLHDEDRRFLEANPAAAAMLGYSSQELIGMHPDDFLLTEDQADARIQVQQLHNDSTLINVRRRLRRKDGTFATVEIRATRLDSGMMISVIRDINAQINYETALMEKERFIRSVIEVLAEGVVVHQSDGAVIYSNRAASRIIGVEDIATASKAFLTEPCWALIRDDHSPLKPESHPVLRVLSSGKSVRNAIMGVLRPDGSRIWLSVNSDPLWDELSKTIIGAVTSFSDITQKQAAEEMLNLKRERLRALSTHLINVREEEKSSFAREIHDELGSSLTAIKMGIEWINEKITAAPPELKQRLEQVKMVTTQAIHATRRIVTQLRPSVLEDLGLWAALEWQIREFCKHSNIACTQHLQCTHIHLPQHLALVVYRIVQEALNNIAKHARASTVHIECWHTEGQLTLTVEDNGIGIDDEVTHHITSYGIRGMYERINQINGTLQILGTPGEGTLVVLTIPYQQTREALSI